MPGGGGHGRTVAAVAVPAARAVTAEEVDRDGALVAAGVGAVSAMLARRRSALLLLLLFFKSDEAFMY